MQRINFANKPAINNGSTNNNNNNPNGTGYGQGQMMSQPTDFFSIMSALQTALVRRQMEFQDWVSNLLGIKNPTLKMLLCLAVMFPR